MKIIIHGIIPGSKFLKMRKTTKQNENNVNRDFFSNRTVKYGISLWTQQLNNKVTYGPD